MEEPEAYRIGWVPFLGTTIHLDSRPLIPRPETEWWVEQFISSIREDGSPREAPQGDGPRTERFRSNEIAYSKRATSSRMRVLDLFAGSGCVGVAVLKHIPNAHVDFGELETRHLPTIQKNIDSNTGADRARVIQTDVYSNITDKYNFILANPPYLAESRIERIEDSVLQHEPREALLADDDGFALVKETIIGLPSHLLPNGQAWIEHEPEHTARVADLARQLGLVAVTHTDQYGVERYSVILLP